MQNKEHNQKIVNSLRQTAKHCKQSNWSDFIDTFESVKFHCDLCLVSFGIMSYLKSRHQGRITFKKKMQPQQKDCAYPGKNSYSIIRFRTLGWI